MKYGYFMNANNTSPIWQSMGRYFEKGLIYILCFPMNPWSIFTDSSKEGLVHSLIVNCSEMFIEKLASQLWPRSELFSLIQWNGGISHPCNLSGPLNFFQAREDCYRFRVANGTSPLLRHHKGHRSNNKDSCSKSRFSLRTCRYSMCKLMIEVLNTVKSVKSIKIKGPREARSPEIWPKTLPEIWRFLKICLGVAGSAWNWLIRNS